MSRDRAAIEGVRYPGRGWVVLLLLLTGVQLGQTAVLLPTMIVLASLLVLALVATLTGRLSWTKPGRLRDPLTWARLAVIIGVVGTTVELRPTLGLSTAALVAVLIVQCVLVSALILAPEGRRTGLLFVGFVAVWTVTAARAIFRTPAGIDVGRFLEAGLQAIGNGHSPYGGSIANPYSPEVSQLYLAPAVDGGDRILVQYPYLPTTLAVDVWGYLAGDIRYAHLACLAAVTAILWTMATDRLGRVVALVPICSPLSVQTLVAYQTEPIVLLGLTALCWALVRNRRTPGLASLGALLLTKQYAIAVLPFLWPVARRWGLRSVAATLAVATLVLGLFFVWDPRGFVRDAVLFQFQQPYRADSTSLLVAICNHLGEPPSWLTGLLPLALGIAVSTLLARRLAPGATAVALCWGLGFLATVLASKQAFTHYYLLVQGALAIAAVVWPTDGPTSPSADSETLVGARHEQAQVRPIG